MTSIVVGNLSYTYSAGLFEISISNLPNGYPLPYKIREFIKAEVEVTIVLYSGHNKLASRYTSNTI